MVIGITGGVGCGKSTVMSILKNEYGFISLEADKIGHGIMKKGQPAYEKIKRHFGRAILDENDEIDRKHLGEIVFANEKELHYLNGIIHPGVRAEIERVIHQNENQNFAVEAALLLEADYQKMCNQVWYVTADDEVRRKRLKESRGYSDEKIERIQKNQMSRQEFEARTDYTIDNSSTIEETRRQIQKILEF